MSDTRGTGFNLSMHWVVGHEGATWNEVTDARAKKAVQGYSSHCALLPSVLRVSTLRDILPASKSAVLQNHAAHLHRQWLAERQSSPRYSKLYALVPSLLHKGFLELVAT
ncbi:hypothetical protein K488DRAFT_61537 [Vararia minispora EC-137]|uniref:Uncharacterized protein n=1 Tax=Vararia minispora EC-137 TaxID=1314806 RepID=A0ACB8Q6P1_9AGAM|nr:hypothetical protein K488DRAFT_61537 [Vararia minispora EC-137]